MRLSLGNDSAERELSVRTGKVDMGSLEFFADNMVKYGLVDKAPDTKAAVHLGGR